MKIQVCWLRIGECRFREQNKLVPNQEMSKQIFTCEEFMQLLFSRENERPVCPLPKDSDKNNI